MSRGREPVLQPVLEEALVLILVHVQAELVLPMGVVRAQGKVIVGRLAARFAGVGKRYQLKEDSGGWEEKEEEKEEEDEEGDDADDDDHRGTAGLRRGGHRGTARRRRGELDDRRPGRRGELDPPNQQQHHQLHMEVEHVELHMEVE